MTWGEESKDEMGSVSLIAVAHENKDRAALQKDLVVHRDSIVAAGLIADPKPRAKLRQLLAEWFFSIGINDIYIFDFQNMRYKRSSVRV